MNAILEVIVCSVADAVAAERGGANRLEIISHYEAGGLTPALELVREITVTVSIPARVMLRETEPFVVRDAAEVERQCARAGIVTVAVISRTSSSAGVNPPAL